MEKKLVLEELYRMRELMGINILSESTKSTISNLLMEGGKTIDNIIGLSPRTVDNLSKNGVDFVNDLTKLSDEFASRGIKNFSDLVDNVAISRGLDPKNITDEMIESYIKNDDELYQSILKKATEAGAIAADKLVKNVELERLFSDNLDQLQSYKDIFSIEPDANNVDDLIEQINMYVNELDNTIDLLEKGGKTVPVELVGLVDELLGKKTDLDNFKLSNESLKSTPPPKPKTDELTPEEEELERLRKQKEIQDSKQNVVNQVKDLIKTDGKWKELGWWPGWLGNKDKATVLKYIEQQLGKYDYDTLLEMARKELKRVNTEMKIRKTDKELKKNATLLERFLTKNPKTVKGTLILGLAVGTLASIYYGFLARWAKGAIENNKEVILGSELDECFSTVTGWADLTDEAKTLFAGLGYGCQNRNKDEAPNDFITSVKYEEADPTSGTASKFIITIGGQVKTVLTSGVNNNNNNTNTTAQYTNDPTGYKKYVEDKGGTYGTTGNYVMQDGTPFYKDSNGNWQAGSYNGTTFVTN